MELFHTPDSQEGINKWIMLQGPSERIGMFTVMGMTWNLLAEEVNKDSEELGGALLKLMKVWEIPNGGKDKSQLLARYVAKNNALEAESEDWECLGQLNDILQVKIDALEAELRNAEGYLWDASDASQWEDYINGVPHLKSEYTKENDGD